LKSPVLFSEAEALVLVAVRLGARLLADEIRAHVATAAAPWLAAGRRF